MNSKSLCGVVVIDFPSFPLLFKQSFVLFVSNTIAPEISLYTARITYQWNVQLESGSIHTKVDPTSEIHVTWTDLSRSGKWVTDFRLPLTGTTASALAADIRVRRQFQF
jgi:hypothetical protein